MARIILKCPYLKGGEKTAAHLNNLVKYIATREGVEKIENGRELWHSTKKQKDLIAQILREFPDTKDLFEYEDYCEHPNRINASEFITMALEHHLDKISDRERYLDYIANRPRVEKFDSHGLFTAGEEPLVLSQVADAVASHTGNVWTPIISLHREDAARMGYDNAAAWRALLSSKAVEIAENLKIHPDHLKWYAAFHNESHHPHIHMICYSTEPREGYLTKQGIKKMKSSLANEIFRQELIPLYGEKSQQRNELKEQTAEAMRDLVQKMNTGVLRNDRIEQLITYLAGRLQNINGKKQYGYLKADLKNVVDEIVDELAKDSRVMEAYRLWWEIRGRIESIYTENPSEPPPLSRCDDFKSIRNMVIQEALHVGILTFEEATSEDISLPEPMDDMEIQDDDTGEEFTEPVDDIEEQTVRTKFSDSHDSSSSWWTDEYKLAKQYLYGDEDEDILQDFGAARVLFLSEAEKGNPLAMYDLGRMMADGLGSDANEEEAHHWYEKALAGFYSAEKKKPWKYTEYRIGKMYAAGYGTEQNYMQAANWLTLSANDNYKYAQYSLGGLYYHGKGVEQNHETAFALYTQSADQDFPYASFELGKMLRDGIGCTKDQAESNLRFQDAFLGFVSLEEKSHDDKLQYRLGWMLLNGVGTEKDEAKAKQYFEKAASVGNLFACYQLAKMILSENAPEPEDLERAFSFLGQAVQAHNPYATYFLGKLYEKGQHVPQNIAEAIRLYALSAEQENDFAAYRLGKLYLDGEGELKDVDMAIRWLTFAAERKNQFAEYALGMIYLKGEDVPKDIKKALEYLKLSAGQGNQFAQYRLGKVYLMGEYVPKDVGIALPFLVAAAEQGNQYAQYTLGKLYLMGEETEKDKAAAIRWFTLSAEQENDFAAYWLGKLYLGGEGVLKDVDMAIRWLTFAAERKNQFAEYALGTLYLKGEDVPKDIKKALEYLKRSAGQGNQFAQYRLAKIYLMGEDAPKDIQSALQFLEAAAEQGNQYAQYILGKLYLMGKDVPKDKDTAVRWFTLSATQGNIYAQFFLDHVNDFKEPSIMLAGTRLLHHVSRIFSDNAPPLKPPGQRTDRKLLHKLREKKQAQGHARDDHEQTMSL